MKYFWEHQGDGIPLLRMDPPLPLRSAAVAQQMSFCCCYVDGLRAYPTAVVQCLLDGVACLVMCACVSVVNNCLCRWLAACSLCYTTHWLVAARHGTLCGQCCQWATTSYFEPSQAFCRWSGDWRRPYPGILSAVCVFFESSCLGYSVQLLGLCHMTWYSLQIFFVLTLFCLKKMGQCTAATI